MKKDLILVRGCSNAGKTEFAKSLGDGFNLVFSADDYFTEWKDGKYEYNFDHTKLKEAHEYCRKRTERAMKDNLDEIFVANTFTQEWEMKPYFDLAEKYGYRVFSIIVENRHGNSNVHDVPEDIVNKQKNRFEIKLI